MELFKSSFLSVIVLLGGVLFLTDAEEIIISPDNVLPKDSTELRERVYNWSVEELKQPPSQVEAHPSAKYFPGKVKDGADRISRRIQMKHTPPREQWVNVLKAMNYSSPFRNTMYSTGLYAAPGEKVTVRIPDRLEGRVKVQIGTHTDNLNQWVAGGQDWRRMPLIWNSFTIEDNTIDVANPFGGLIYITCPPREEAWEADITVENAVKAPYYKFGETSQQEWEEMLNSGAPWGEMATENIILTLPTSALKKIENPEENMVLWDKIVGAITDLAQMPMPFYRAQRLVTDVHIGGGYMHSGYPIMITHSPSTNNTSEEIMVDPQKLVEGSGGGANWGFFHEIGHNMQNMNWVFGGSTAVSVNFFSLYVFDTVVGGRKGAHSGVSPEQTRKYMRTYFRNGANFEDWKGNPFLGLITFRQIQKAFGWSIFKETFRKYHTLAGEDRPETDQEKRTMLIRYLSQSAEWDLSAFFAAWGFPVEKSLKNDLEKYQSWMPYNFPPDNQTMSTDEG